MTPFSQYITAEALEAELGDPLDCANIFSFKNCISLDELEQYPEAIIDLLNRLNIHHYFIPSRYGGKLTSFEEVLAIARVLARRDLTVTIAYGVTYLGSLPIWIGGTEKQKAWLAETIKTGNKISFGLTEEEHGSDILASETEAIEVDNRYVLSGKKWLIGNGSTSSICTIFARIDNRNGPRSFMLFLVNKGELNQESYCHLPKIKTLGLRGADISGISFNGCQLSKEASIGKAGSGFEIALKTLQITRTLHAGAALSLGQADTALRATLSFVLQRKLYKATAWDIPQVKEILIESFLNILICECISIATVRAIHSSPEQMSIFSSIVKYFVPTQVDCLIHKLSSILGARCFLREGHYQGIFQKISRDHSIVNIFDGNIAVNLYSIILQIKQLTNYRNRSKNCLCNTDYERQKLIFDLNKPLPEVELENLQLYNRGQNDIIQGLEEALHVLGLMQENSDIDPEILKILIVFTNHLIDEIDAHDRLIDNLDEEYIYKNSKSSELFAIAKKYCNIHSASACLQIWVYNRQHFRSFVARGEWLVVCLSNLIKPNDSSLSISFQKYFENCAEELLNLYKNNNLFSIIDFQLAGNSQKK